MGAMIRMGKSHRRWNHGCEHRRYVLGITSLWLIVPVAAAFREGIDDYRWYRHVLLAWTCLTCIVSTLFWASLGTSYGSCLYRTDKLCAHVQFAGLLALFAIDQACGRSCFHMALTVPILILACYGGSRIFEVVHPNDPLATASHLVFRFLGYWWTYVGLVPCPPRRGYVLANSALYWGHVAYVVSCVGVRPSFVASDAAQYGRGCAQVAALAALVLVEGGRC